MGLRESILALPEADQLEAALTALDELSSASSAGHRFLVLTYGLTATEAAIVAALVKAPDQSLTRDALYRVAFGFHREPIDQTLTSHICRARKKGVDIKAISSWGYRLVEPIELPSWARPNGRGGKLETPGVTSLAQEGRKKARG